MVVTKADLLASTGVADRMPDGEHVRDWLCDPDGLGLGNTARLAEQYFGEVAYFSTAAVDGEAGTDPSVLRLTHWMLERQGILYTRESHA
ncbi:hypothetical protein Acsp03_37350 [Actinomadura sp. NBRC 104412]|uniref:hypothetical protein n=1 Tax=Actinomadura sp. NBRC 104412 TaxID=3032203 RepID=UPI0024A09917|nr:hypothetical protein [Actinomadura sp. NBRC 104412]GLZ06269.1 hypothetical protein Acsp03_37350 [Actinomadura sp. NBRC 104412]